MKRLKVLSILIVEDDTDLRELMSEDFAGYSTQIGTADSGLQALEKISEKKYDIIICDMYMPKGDGRFLAQELLKIDGVKPLLFLYSGINDFSGEEKKALNIAEIFTKPCKTTDMVNMILKHLN